MEDRTSNEARCAFQVKECKAVCDCNIKFASCQTHQKLFKRFRDCKAGFHLSSPNHEAIFAKMLGLHVCYRERRHPRYFYDLNPEMHKI